MAHLVVGGDSLSGLCWLAPRGGPSGYHPPQPLRSVPGDPLWVAGAEGEIFGLLPPMTIGVSNWWPFVGGWG